MPHVGAKTANASFSKSTNPVIHQLSHNFDNIYESSSKLRHIASVIVSVQRYNKPIISVHIPTISVGAYKKSNPIMKDEADDIQRCTLALRCHHGFRLRFK